MATSLPKSHQWKLGTLALLPYDVDVSNDLSVAGNFTVAGTQTLSGETAMSKTYSTAAADVDGPLYVTATAGATLGNYANAANFKLDFTSGAVTGLGGVVCAELDLSANTSSGSYACFEAELNAPASASTGTRTSFLSLNAWGANVAAVDSNGYLFDLNGVTGDTSKLFDNDGGSVAATELVAGLRILINGTAYRIPLCTEADFYD